MRTVAEALGLEPDQTVIRMLPEPGPASARHAGPATRLLLLALLAALLVVGTPWMLWRLLAGPPSVVEASTSRVGEERMVREDRVRALAEVVDAVAPEAAAAPPPPSPSR